MRRKTTIWFAFLMVSIVVGSGISYGQTVTVTADIGGVQKSGASPLDISGAYGNIRIAQYNTSAGPARVEVVGNDGSQDFLVIKNAKITANAPVTNYRIAYWGTLTPDPNSSAVYQTRIIASLMRGANGAMGNSVKVKGWMDNSQIGSDISKTIDCNTPPPCGIINDTKSGTKNPSGNRVMKGEFWLTMTQANDVFNLPSGSTSGVAVKNTTAAEPPDDQDEKEQNKPKKE